MFSSRVEDEMGSTKKKAIRFFSDEKQLPVKSLHMFGRPANMAQVGSGSAESWKDFPEDQELWKKGILDPASDLLLKWNQVYLGACLIGLFIDPLFFYLPKVENAETSSPCIKLNSDLSIVLTLFRTLADIFHVLHIALKFRTAYVAPSSRVFGRGELIVDRWKIARRYLLQKDFYIDFFAALPLPQIVVWIILPAAKRMSNAGRSNNTLALIVLIQYLPRLYLIFPLMSEIINATGVVTKTAWAGATYNLCLYMLASHVFGAAWYLSSIDRQSTCWKSECGKNVTCHKNYFDCDNLDDQDRISWAKSTMVFNNCNASIESISFKYGIFENALTKDVVSAKFLKKYFYCLWWGLQQLSSYGQNLETSTFMGETSFAILIAIVGLILFAHLIGNMQTYLQSLTVRLEEWRLKRRDTEEWMRHRQLPHDLRERVHKYVQYKWVATRGVDEDAILQGLPPDLRRDIQHQLCLDLVRRVSFFSQMDEPLLDAICERLVSWLSTEGTYIVREGDPVTEMLFVIRGMLKSSTTNGGRTGFFNSTILRPGDFCGEELLTWALDPRKANLPSSTQTVLALVEVEAFALRAEDLKFVANQFRKLHSKKLQHTFRFHSHQFRTWAACFIQAAWHRYKRRKITKDLSTQVSFASRYDGQVQDYPSMEKNNGSENPSIDHNIGATVLISTKRSASMVRAQPKVVEKLQKPEEPDFSSDSF